MIQPQKGSYRLRIGHISAPQVIYFVTTCVEDWRPLLRGKDCQQVMHESLSFAESAGWMYWYCYNVMPDYLHIHFRVLEEKTLSELLGSIKKYTARQINQLVGGLSELEKYTKSGSGEPSPGFWQEGYFDHRIRSEQDFWETVLYIFLNPVEAGLVADGWRWPGWRCKPEVERWLRQWEADTIKHESWMKGVRKKRKDW